MTRPSVSLMPRPGRPSLGTVATGVHGLADSVPAVVRQQPVAGAARCPADRVAQIPHLVPDPGRIDAAGQGGLGGVDQGLVRRVRCTHDEADRRVAAPALEKRAAVHAEQVTVLEPVVVGDAVHHGVVDRRADHPGKRD